MNYLLESTKNPLFLYFRLRETLKNNANKKSAMFKFADYNVSQLLHADIVKIIDYLEESKYFEKCEIKIIGDGKNYINKCKNVYGDDTALYPHYEEFKKLQSCFGVKDVKRRASLINDNKSEAIADTQLQNIEIVFDLKILKDVKNSIKKYLQLFEQEELLLFPNIEKNVFSVKEQKRRMLKIIQETYEKYKTEEIFLDKDEIADIEHLNFIEILMLLESEGCFSVTRIKYPSSIKIKLNEKCLKLFNNNSTGQSENFVYNPETGLGKYKDKDFKLTDGTSYKKLFDSAYAIRGKKLKRDQVIKTLKLENEDEFELAPLERLRNSKKPLVQINNTKKINETSKTVRKKTGLNTKTFSNNSGNIVLNI